MKEVTEWNGKPRWMWCWDDNEHDKCKEYVVCVMTEEEMKECGGIYPVCTYDLNYKHCAEIEESTKRPCTREELVEMLKKQGLPMLKNADGKYYTISKIDSTKVIFCDESFFPFDCERLCTMFTLLDGTELWVEE